MGSSALKLSGVKGPTVLETIARREALALALDLNISNILVASDCKEVVEDIKNGTGGMHGSTVQEIRSIAASSEYCSFTLEGRNTNVEAQNLTKFALCLTGGRHVWFIQPHDINCILMNIDQ